MILKIEMENMRDPQLLTAFDSSQFDPTIKSLCGVVSAHNKAAYISLKDCVIIRWPDFMIGILSQHIAVMDERLALICSCGHSR